MFCTNCGSKLPEGAAFCTNCGAKVISDESDLHNQTTLNLNEDISGRDIASNVNNNIPISDVEETVVIPTNPQQHSSSDDTQAVFNDIQESLANPEMNFVEEVADRGFRPEPNGSGGSPSGPEGPIEPGNSNDNDNEDDSGQAPKQKKVLWLVVGIVAAAVVVVVIIIAIIFMLSPGKRQRDAYENQVTQGEEFIKNSNYDDAIEAFRDAIEIDKNEEDAYVGLADAYIKNKEYRKAAEILQQGSKVSGSKERIEEKKEELYNLAPELEEEFESQQEDSKSSQSESQVAQNDTTQPVTQAPESETTPPATQAPESETTPPVTQAPESETTPPATQAPESETTPPATQAPESETTPPATQAPESETTPPATQAPESETTPPATQAPETGDSESPSQSESESSLPEETQESDSQDSIYVVGNFQYRLLTYESSATFDDGSVGGYTKVVYPYLLGDTDGEKAINRAMEAYIDQASENENATEALTGEEDYEFPLYYESSVEIIYNDYGMISMSFAGTANNGSGKDNIGGGFIFYESDGQKLSMSDVLYGDQEDIQSLITQYYLPQENENVPAEEFVRLMFEGADNFYLTDKGLYCSTYNEENINLSVLIPFTAKEWFRFLSDIDPAKEQPVSEVSWILEPSLEFQDMPVIMDDSHGSLAVTAGQYDLAVYERDGKLGFIDYDGKIISEPLYNCVFSCQANDSQTLFASLAGSDVWSASAINPESGQTMEGTHQGHGGNESILVYSRSDGKLYALSFDGYTLTENSSGEAVPAVVVDDIAGADFDKINVGEGVVYGICSPEGTVDENYLYDRIYTASDQRMVALSQGKYGVIDTDGNEVIPFEFEGANYLDFEGISQDPGSVLLAEGQPYPYSEGYISLKKDGQWGYYDMDGQCVTGMVFEEARPVHNGRAFVKQDGKWGIIEIAQPEEQASEK